MTSYDPRRGGQIPYDAPFDVDYDPRRPASLWGGGRPRGSILDEPSPKYRRRQEPSLYNPRDRYHQDRLDGGFRPSRRESPHYGGRDLPFRTASPDSRYRHGSSRDNRSHSLDTHRAHDRGRHSGNKSHDRNDRRRSSTTSRAYPPRSPSPRSSSHAGRGGQSNRHYPPTSTKSSGNPRGRSSSRSHRSPAPNTDGKVWMNAVKCAAEAGAMAALKARNEPGEWLGSKGASVATAALGAAVVDTLVDQRHPKVKGSMRHVMAKHVAQSALGSFVPRKS